MGQASNTLLLKALVTAALLALPAIRAGGEEYPLRDAVECHPRSGLPNFRQKVEAGEKVKIAYLGGSITAAAGWRVQSREWFQEQYPEAEFEEIFAAIGGTGSDLGVFRLRNDVLRHEPDLLFIEFAVNDGGAPPARIHKAMEGIVRQTWRADPSTDICFVYTVSLPVMPDLRAGRMQRSASAMEELADHYGIPSIHFGVKVASLEASGGLVIKAPKPENLAEAKPIVFSTDGVHPHAETGHRIYTGAIARSWPGIRGASKKPGDHPLPEPLRDDNWENAKQVAISADMLKGSWQKLAGDHALAKRFARNMPVLHQATHAGASLEFSFRGTTAAVFDLLGSDGGSVTVQVDDDEPVARNKIDGYCTYHRMAKTPILSDGADKVHRVRIALTDEQLDKRDILFERNRADFDSKPEKYAGHTWYAGSLLIIGEIVAE